MGRTNARPARRVSPYGVVGAEHTVLGDAPGVVYEELTLGLVVLGWTAASARASARSRPQVTNGVVRHRLRLLMMGAA